MLAVHDAIEWSPELILALAGFTTAIGGIFTTVTATKTAKKEAIKLGMADCERRLHDVRLESEALAEELHILRMKEQE